MSRTRKTIAILVAAAMLLSLPAAIAADDNSSGSGESAPFAPDIPAVISGKDEVVYARLSGGGEVRSIYVVNQFTVEQGGVITDYGNYSRVVNLTDLGEILMNGNTVSLPAASGDFFYQGDLKDSELPWIYAIEYKLDGAVIQPGALGGKSGRLEVSLNSRKNDLVDSTFFDNYMQQITFTLNTEKCSNIKADGATSANAGKNRMLVFTILPRQNARISVTADVKDFEMPGVDINAMPFSMSLNIPDVDDMLDEFTLLSDAIADLSDGVDLLDSGTLEMLSGMAQLVTGSSEFRTGLNELNANSGQLTSASVQIMDALAQIPSALSGADVSFDMSELSELPVFFSSLADGLSQLSGSLKQLSEGYYGAYSALDTAISGIPGHQISEAQLSGLYGKASNEERILLDQLLDSHTASATVKSTHSQVRGMMDSVSVSLDTLAGSVDSTVVLLNVINSQIDTLMSGNALDGLMGQLGLLTAGLSELSSNYVQFHNGLVAFMGGASALASGYSMIDDGFQELYLGAEELSDGISQLNDGTAILADETSEIPDRVKSEIDSLISDYEPVAFEPVSFTSAQNRGVSFVQFVFKTASIEKPLAKTTAPDEAETATFLDRFLALFGK